jgi:type IV secretory pathway VirB2 component (pilin)
MSDDLDIFRFGIRRFRYGGIAVAALPLVLGVALMLGDRPYGAWQMILISLILLFLVFWATHCAEDVVSKLQAGR